MFKSISIIIFLGCLPLLARTQNFTYKHDKHIALTKLNPIRLSEVPHKETELTPISEIAPEPFNDAQQIKVELDKNRKRKFTSSLHKYQQESGDIAPSIVSTFDALPTGSSGIPNDNNMAISNAGMVVSVMNSNISVFSPDGTRLTYKTLENIVSGQLPQLNRTYDPKVVYDPDSDRFILVFLQGSTSNDTRIIVGFTKTNDPVGLWNFYAIEGNPFGGKTWSDYPIIGLSKEDLYISVNILRDNESWQAGFTQSVIWQINKSAGYTGADSVYRDVFYDLKYMDKPIWSICAVQGGMAPSGPGMYFLSVRPGAANNDSLFLHEIDNTQQSGNAKYSLKVLKTSKPYGVPPSAFQPDASNVLQTNDTRVLSAMEQNGTIQYVQTTLIPSTGSSGVFHGLVDLASGRVENNYIFSDTFDYAYPSIAFSGDATHPWSSVITFSHSSELHFPGTSVIFHNRVNGHESLYSPVTQIKGGDVSINRLINDSNERWGDYTGIQRRYNRMGEVWACGSYGKIGNRNSTWIGEVRVNNDLTVIDQVNTMVLLPNPTMPISIARISTEQDEELSFEMYDAAGKLVLFLNSRPVKMGSYEFVLNTTPYRSGMYELVAYRKNREVYTRTKVMLR